jgi:hypothetical protein
MCPMCMIRAAMLAIAAVSTGGLATYAAARMTAARERGRKTCSKCDNPKER